MVLPLWDENPFTAPVKPVVTWGLIALNVLIFVVQIAVPGDAVTAAAIGFGATPAAVLHLDPLAIDMQRTGSGGWLWPELTIITSMFLHGDVLHLLGNMLFLFVFGDNIELTLGRTRFLIFYIVCGIGAALAYIPRSRHNPKILWVDDAEIIGDRITEVRPILGNIFTQEPERRIGELGASCVAFVVRDVSVHEAP